MLIVNILDQFPKFRTIELMSDWKEKILQKAKTMSDGVPEAPEREEEFQLKELPLIFQNEEMAKIFADQGHVKQAARIRTQINTPSSQGFIELPQMGKYKYELSSLKSTPEDFFLSINKVDNRVKITWSIGEHFKKLFWEEKNSLNLILVVSFVISKAEKIVPLQFPLEELGGQFVLESPGLPLRSVLVQKNENQHLKLLVSDLVIF